jgi:hypothetical protein
MVKGPGLWNVNAVDHHPKPQPALPRKKRRWLFWLGISLGGLVLLAAAGFVGVVSYYHSLLSKHTQNHPLALTELDRSEEAQRQVKSKWGQFYKAVLDGDARESLQLSPHDLNLLVAGIPNLGDRFRIEIENDRLQARFSIPLEKPNKPELKGRYLNGVAVLNLKLEEDGFLTLHVAEVRANEKPIPGWLLRALKKKNLLGFFDRNVDYMEFLVGIRGVEVKDGNVVFRPVQGT